METIIKQIVNRLFPNLGDDLYLFEQKKKDRKLIKEITGLSVSEYPEYLSRLYKRRTGHDLNIDAPKRLTEKIQWRKLYDRDPTYTILSDKYTVRDWVKKKVGGDYIIPLLGFWEDFDDIDFQLLPDQFVLKTNNASHTNIIVTDKKQFLRKKQSAKRRMNYWMNTSFAFLEGLELQYQTIKPAIIAEKYLPPENGKQDLIDYKFHCFRGNPYVCQVIGDRSTNETIDFYDRNWEHIPVSRPPFPNAKQIIEKPENYDLLLGLAETLSNGFQYVRVDLYDYNGKVYFGEMTFTPTSGFMRFDPDDWDYKLGDLWDINADQINESIVGINK